MIEMSCEEMQELITGLVDNHITNDERSLLTRHLEECPACSDAVKLERRIRAVTRSISARIQAPPGLTLALQRRYGIGYDSLWARARMRLPMTLRPVPLMILVILAAVPLAFFIIGSNPAVSVAALETHRAVVSGSVASLTAESPELLAERLSRAVGGRFRPPVFDLARFGLHTAGGFKETIGNRDVLVTVYRGQGGTLTCNTFLGDERDIPEKAELIYDPLDGRRYFTFSNGSVNGVLQRHGDEVCILASALPMDELIQVARSLPRPNHG